MQKEESEMINELNEIFHPDRFFGPSSEIIDIARELYSNVKDLPIVSPHGHVDPKLLALNQPFPDPTELFLIPDHYIFRMLYSQGIRLEDLGIPTIDGTPVETDHKKIWKIFAENFHLFLGTPTGIWLTHELNDVFGITERLNSRNAIEIYNLIEKKLNEPDMLPRNLFDRFNIEVLSTTDSASDDLEYHKMIKESDWNGRVIPTFRPDAVVNIDKPEWKEEIQKLARSVKTQINNFSDFIEALKARRKFFIEMGAVATDHGVQSAYTHELEKSEIESIFKKAIDGKTTAEDTNAFVAHMLIEFARMSLEDGLVMQIHAGANRNHNNIIADKFGSDKGCDIPGRSDFTNGLKELLNKFGNNPHLTIIVFTLDETTYSRELAPLAGHYPALKIGPAWWFHDSIEGMTRYRERITETAGFYNTVGFNDDTRAFLSIPARHDVARRVDSNFVAGLVVRHIITFEEGQKIMKDLTYNLVKKAYKL